MQVATVIEMQTTATQQLAQHDVPPFLQDRQNKLKDEAATAHRGLYLCRMDASHTFDAVRDITRRLFSDPRNLAADISAGKGLARLQAIDWGHLRAPVIRQVLVQNSIDVPTAENDVFHLQARHLRSTLGASQTVILAHSGRRRRQ